MTPTSLPVSSLRAHLLSSLASLPGSRTFHLHVLVSSPRKPTQSLFPYTSPRPKCHFQDILVLLSEEVSSIGAEHDSSSSAKANPTSTSLEPRTFVTAIETNLYSFPTSDSTILYIAKVDGTGQGIFPSPTSTLLHALVLFYASPRSPVYVTSTTHHLWIHLFARSQRQYLFPNSADHPNKKPLGDVALCKWWKKNLSDIAISVEDSNKVKTDDVPAVVQSSRLYYLLPGQSEQEASYLLRETQPSPVKWIYSHPYDIHEESLPFPSDPDNFSSERQGRLPLASLIPYFEDDPKSRFLDELAATSEEHSVAVPIPTPKKKRQKIGDGADSSNSTLTDNHHVVDVIDHLNNEADEASTLFPPPEIVYIPPSSSPARGHSPPSCPSTPKPRVSNRPALLSPHTPDLPTFPINAFLPLQTPISVPSRTTTTPQRQTTITSPRTPQTPRTPRRPVSDLDTISVSEFWERMSYRQECAQGAVTGFFVAIFSLRSDTPASNGEPDDVASRLPSTSKARARSLDPSAPAEIDPPLLLEGTVPHSVIKRVMSSLLTGVEFSTAERTHKGTRVIETAIRGLCESLGHTSTGHLAKDSEHRFNADKIAAEEPRTANPHIYETHVYSSLLVSNPPLVRKYANSPGAAVSSTNPPVNVLSVRRKKKRE